MRSVLKRIIPFIAIVLFSFLSCDDDKGEYTFSEGLITGFNPAEPICMWEIDINRDTFLIANMPVEFGNELYQMEMPVPVTLSWKLREDDGFFKMIVIKDIAMADLSDR